MGIHNRERHKKKARKRLRRCARSTPPQIRAGVGQTKFRAWKLSQKLYKEQTAWYSKEERQDRKEMTKERKQNEQEEERSSSR